MPTVRSSPERLVRALPLAALAAALTLAAGGLACANDPTAPAAPGENMPTVGQTPGSFGLSVRARAWTTTREWSADLPATLSVGLSIVGYDGGTGALRLTDATGTAVYVRDLTQAGAEGSTVVRGRPPYRLQLTTTGYTGIVALGIGAAPAGSGG